MASQSPNHTVENDFGNDFLLHDFVGIVENFDHILSKNDFEELQHFEGELLVVGLDRFVTLPDELDHFDEDAVDLVPEVINDVFVEGGGKEEFVEETEDEVGTSDHFVVDEHHAATTDCSRTGHRQIRHFEQDLHFQMQFDAFPVRKTQNH